MPDALSVVGFDGIALAQDLTPALTTVTQPNSAIGRHSVELLIGAIAQRRTLTPDDSVLLAHGFADGESIAAPPLR